MTVCGLFLLLTIGMGIYIVRDYLCNDSIVKDGCHNWIDCVGFFGVFALLTIILKYLSVILNLIFKRQRYLIADIEKVVKG